MILSWARPGQGGYMHVNEKYNGNIIQVIRGKKTFVDFFLSFPTVIKLEGGLNGTAITKKNFFSASLRGSFTKPAAKSHNSSKNTNLYQYCPLLITEEEGTKVPLL